MARASHAVFKALRRWEEKGLLEASLVRKLEDEVTEEYEGESIRWSQYLLAATGGAVLIVAGGTFLTWAWPEMGAAGQSVTLGIMGLLVMGLGMRLPRVKRWVPVALLLEVAGSVLLLMALVHSEKAWLDGTLGGVGAGLIGLALPVGLVWKALKENSILAALQSAMSFIFLFLFLDRALGLSEVNCLWILDGVMALGLGFLAFRLRDPAVPGWVLHVFLALLFSALVLVIFSADMIWDLEDLTVIPMDVWLLATTGLTLWGLQERAPAHLRRDWFEWVLALCVLMGMIFGFITMLELLETGPTPAAVTVATVGALGLWWALPRGSRSVIVVSCVTLLIAAWYWGAEMSGALGSVLALLAVSSVLFWGASRVGRSVKNSGMGPGEE